METDTAAGLTEQQVRDRLAEYGENQLIATGERGPALILWEQLSGAMVVLLAVAAGVSMFLHEYTDAIAILAIMSHRSRWLLYRELR